MRAVSLWIESRVLSVGQVFKELWTTAHGTEASVIFEGLICLSVETVTLGNLASQHLLPVSSCVGAAVFIDAGDLPPSFARHDS